MLRVALTGGVGSGKSAAAVMLRDLGAFVSQSDEVGRALMQPGQPVFDAIRDQFGPAVISGKGELDRSVLAEMAFEQGRLEDLNAIVHPAVIAAQACWMDAVGKKDPCAVAVVESALIFETKHAAPSLDDYDSRAPWRPRFDRIVVITTPITLRRDRYVQRAGTPSAAADFNHRVAAQWSDEQKAALADFVIPNGGSLEELKRRMDTLFLQLRQEAADAVKEAM